MNIYALNAGGYYAIGTAVIVAENLERAVKLANTASNPKWGLTYHGITSGEPIATDVKEYTTCRVLNIHEWGMPELPSKGSGKKVTF